MSGQNQIDYQEKYLKYKAKYLELKRLEKEQSGGLTFLDGEYTFFIPSKVMSEKKIQFKAGADAPNVKTLNDTFNGVGYRIKKNSNKLELLMESDVKSMAKKALGVGGLLGTVAAGTLMTGLAAVGGIFLERKGKEGEWAKSAFNTSVDMGASFIEDIKKGKVPQIITLDKPFDGSDDEAQALFTLITGLPNPAAQAIDTALTIQINSGIKKNKFVSQTTKK